MQMYLEYWGIVYDIRFEIDVLIMAPNELAKNKIDIN
jgi:hypothetical protein